MDVFNDILNSLSRLVEEAGPYALRLLVAALILVVGWLVGKLLRKGSIALMRLAMLDRAAEKAGIEEFLLKGGVRFTTVSLIGELIYWAFFFLTLFVAFGVLGLETAQHLLGRIILYTPTVFVSLAIIIFGSLVAKFVKALVGTYLNNVGVEAAVGISTFAQISIWAFTIYIVLEQFSVPPVVMASVFQIAVGGIALGFGIAIGFGGQDLAKRMVEKIYKLLS